jgi:hypothetical protein
LMLINARPICSDCWDASNRNPVTFLSVSLAGVTLFEENPKRERNLLSVSSEVNFTIFIPCTCGIANYETTLHTFQRLHLIQDQCLSLLPLYVFHVVNSAVQRNRANY